MIYRARAPLRVTFAGGGTDLIPWSVEKGSYVVSAAINKFARCDIYPREQKRISVDSWPQGILDHALISTQPVTEEAAKDRIVLRNEQGLAMLKAVLNLFGITEEEPIMVSLDSEASIATGLGSSSALIVATLQAFDDYYRALHGAEAGPVASMTRDANLPHPLAIAKLAWEVERKVLGQPGGWQDHLVAAYGGLNAFKAPPGSEWPWGVKDTLREGVHDHWWSPEGIAELEVCSLLAYVGRRERGGQIEALQATMKGDALRDMMKIAERVHVELRANDFSRFGIDVYDAWQAKMKLVPSLAPEAAQTAARIALRSGAIGAKLVGAGGGGFLYICTQPDLRNRVINALAQAKIQCWGFGFEQRGLHSWSVPT